RMSAQEIGSFWTNRSNILQIVDGQILDACVELSPFETLDQSVKRLLLTQVRSETMISGIAMNAEKWRPGTVRLYHDERLSDRLPTLITYEFGHLFNCRCLKHVRKSEIALRRSVHLSEQTNRLQRMPSQLEKIVGDADALCLQQRFPNLTQL